MKYSCVIVGGGIVGTSLFSYLERKGVSTLLVEKGEDVALGATKANSGIVHAGYDCGVNTLKAKLNVEGSIMYPKEAKRLGEKLVKCGSLVVAGSDGLEGITELYNRGVTNGVKSMKILKRPAIKKIVPNIADDVEYALYAKTAGIISPYSFCIAYAEEGIVNGGRLMLNTEIKKASFDGKEYTLTLTGGEEVKCDFVINCAGAGVNEVSKVFKAETLPVKLVKGEYLLLDKGENLTPLPIFPLPTKKGKGILVMPTVAGNTALGPTAVDIENFETSVSPEGVKEIKSKVAGSVQGINYRKVIKLYAGVRVKVGDDFYIKFSEKADNYLFVAGICSPGLTSAPAIAEYATMLLKEKGLVLDEGKKAVRRKPYTKINNMCNFRLNRLVKKDSDYGRVVCRCENITAGEIKEVLDGPIKPLTTDGVKRRLRTTMGRCQGSFCYPSILDIMSKHYNVDKKQIKFKSKSSVVTGDIKEGGIYDL